MQLVGRKYTQVNSAYRYGFNGKENDNGTGEGNLDFGARIMDVRLGRWLSVDPAFSKSPSFSTYSYCFDNPIIYTDPDGEYPLIVITNEVSGYTFAHVYGVGGKTATVIVKTYKAIVYDVNAKGERKQLSEFYVTRDGFYNNGQITTVKKEPVAGGKTKTTTTTEDLLVNRTSEPKNEDVTLGATPTLDYGETKGAYSLGTVESITIPSSWDISVNGESIPPQVKRSSPDKANSVMIHIGGFFTKAGGENNLGGTYGCYGIVDPSQVFASYTDAEKNLAAFDAIETNGTAPDGFTSSNNQMNKLVNTVQAATALASKRKEKDASKISVTIKKRAADSYKKEVKVKTGSSSVVK